MFPDRPIEVSGSRRAVAAGRFSTLRAAADAGERVGSASQSAPRVERRVRRVSQVRPGRRSTPAGLAGLRPVGSVLRQGVRGRYQPALLPRVDTSGSMGFGSAGVSKLEYARRIAGALGHLALQQGDAVGLSCVAGGIVRNIPPAAQSVALDDRLRRTGANRARRARPSSCRCCTSWRRPSRSGL